MVELPISICNVNTPEGKSDYITCLSDEHVFEHGLAPQAIIGVLQEPVGSGGEVRPENFARNPVFVDFMHSVIARHSPQLPGMIAEARRQLNGFVYIIDQRTRTPQGAVPPEDIFGGFEVKDGELVAHSYQPNPNYKIFSTNGFFQLGPELQSCLLEEMKLLRP